MDWPPELGGSTREKTAKLVKKQIGTELSRKVCLKQRFHCHFPNKEKFAKNMLINFGIMKSMSIGRLFLNRELHFRTMYQQIA